MNKVVIDEKDGMRMFECGCREYISPPDSPDLCQIHADFDFEDHYKQGEPAWDCNYCGDTFFPSDLKEHTEICIKFQINAKTEYLEQKAVEIHLNKNSGWLIFIDDTLSSKEYEEYKILITENRIPTDKELEEYSN